MIFCQLLILGVSHDSGHVLGSDGTAKLAIISTNPKPISRREFGGVPRFEIRADIGRFSELDCSFKPLLRRGWKIKHGENSFTSRLLSEPDLGLFL